MSVEHSLLGKDTNYPTAYQPDVLFPISRAPARENYAHVDAIQQGKDWWHIFEISWHFIRISFSGAFIVMRHYTMRFCISE